MAERATIQQVVQIGVETTPGTAVLTTKRLSALGTEASPQADIAQFKPMGTKFTTVTALGKEWVEADLSGQLTYSEIIYPLASVLGNMATTPSGSGYSHVFEPKSGLADVIKTFTVQVGSRERAYRFTNGIVSEFGISFSRDSIELSGTMIGRAIEDPDYLDTNEKYVLTANATPPSSGNFTLTHSGNTTANIAYNASPAAVQSALEALVSIGTGNVLVTAGSANTGAGTLAVGNNTYEIEFIKTLGQQAVTLTGTFASLTASGSIVLSNPTDGAAPTQVVLKPVLPHQVSLYLAAADSGPWDSTTKLLRAISAEFNISDRFGPVYVLDQAQGTSFVTHVETEPTTEITLTVQNDSQATTLLNQMRDGSTRYLLIRAVGDLISTGVYHQFDMLLAVKVSEHGGFSDQDGVYAAEYTLTVVDDSAWGHAMQVTVVNTLATL